MTTATPMLPRLDLIRADGVMHAGLVGCDASAPLPVIARTLSEEGIHCVVVGGIERTRGGERLTWGIVSDRDLGARPSSRHDRTRTVDASPDRHPNPRKYVRIPFGIRAAPGSVGGRSGRTAFLGRTPGARAGRHRRDRHRG